MKKGAQSFGAHEHLQKIYIHSDTLKNVWQFQPGYIVPRTVEGFAKIINLTRPSEEFPFFILFAVRVIAFRRVSPLKNFPADAPAKEYSLRISDAFFRVMYIFAMTRENNNIRGCGREGLWRDG